MKKFFISLALLLILPVSLVFVGCKPKPKGLILNTEEVKIEYIVGDAVDLSDLTVKLRYSDGTTEDIEDFTTDITGVNTAAAGEYTVVVKYDKFSANFKITYYDKGTITAVANNVYYVGQDCDSAYPSLKFVSGKGEIYNNITYSSITFDNQTIGEKVATVQYMNRQYECKVQVLSKEDYFEYLKGKVVEAAVTYGLNNLTLEKGDEFYFLNGAAGDGSYGKIGNNETYVKDADVTRYIDGQVQEPISTYTDYNEALRNAYQSVAGLVQFPVAEAYAPLVEKIFLAFANLENAQEVEYETEDNFLTVTVKLQGSEDVAVMLYVDLRDYSVMGAKLDGWDISFNINYEIPQPSQAPQD